MDTLTSMRVFTTVVGTGSFTGASDRLDMSRAMVSKYVFNLEEHLGTRLLNRTTRRLSLTESGLAYYERCLQIISDVEEAEQAAGQLTTTPRGTLKITMPFAFGLHRLGPVIADYVHLHSEVKLDLSLNDRYVDLIEEGFDLAIRIGTLPESRLIARKLGVASSIVCASPAYLKQHGIPTQPSDLNNHSCLGYTYTNSGNEWRFKNKEMEEVVHITGAIKANNGDMLRHAALNGGGLILQPLFIVEDDLQSGRLVQVLGDYTSTEYGIYAVYPSRKFLSAKVRTFVDFLVGRVSAMSD
ncbi:MAG: LysR family transcriptional regulator [Candidatus Gallionella acididurans]|uniref:LysR family transcriptional regulator n=1 Tax=Candidatus Gallionella acididurans TaxID=1796491 RepID=A0A139BV05_9PROT|nr:MAG: LysR family transcriptional regulator [Candidatus Gallionella acididurans]